MNKFRFAFVAVLIILFLAMFFGTDAGVTAGKTTMTEDEYSQALGQALKDIIEKIKPRAKARLVFRANLFFAHETAIKNMPLNILKQKVDAFKEAGVSGVDINMGLFPWLDMDKEAMAKYDSLIDYIRQLGLTLALDPAYSYVYHKVTDFKDWTGKAEIAWTEMARRYRPDIFVVVHEPTTQDMRMGFENSVQDWARFTERIARKIKEISPHIRLAAGVHAKEYGHFKEFVKIDLLDYISFDVYSLAGLKSINRMIPEARKAGKRVYIEETWRPPYFVPGSGLSLDYILAKGIGLSKFKELDFLWLEMITLYASVWKMDSITPFWTQAFFKYVENKGDALDKAYNLRVMKAITQKERTETFHHFAKLIRAYQKINANKSQDQQTK